MTRVLASKNKYLSFLAGCLLLSLSSTALADPSGVWRTQKSAKGSSIDVQVTKCGNNYCGKAIKTYDSDQDVTGTVIIKDMQPLGNGHYGGGLIYAPDTKKWYRSKMFQLNPNQLKVSGCVLKFICRSQIWTRQ